MSTSANLPAGFSLTTVNGQKCTAIPKIAQAGGGGGGDLSTASVVVSSTTAAATTTSISTTPQTTASPTSVPPVFVSTSSPPPPAAPSTTAAAITSAAPIKPPPSSTPIVNVPPPTTSAASLALTTSNPPVGVSNTVAKTSAVVPTSAISSSNPFSISSIVGPSSLIAISASPASRGTTPTESSGTPLAIAQSEVSATPTIASLARTTLSSARATSAAASNSIIPSAPISSSSSTNSEASKESTDAGISSGPRMTAGPVVGGVLGSMAFIAGLAFLIFFCIKRRKRQSLITPLGTGTRDEFYRDEKSGGPMSTFDNDNNEKWSRSDKLKATAAGLQMGLIGLGAKLKKTVVRHRSDSPSVNLNRGNSQFLDGPIPQHSRNNSVSSVTGAKPGVKERFTEWWTKFKKLHMPMLSEPEDPFTAARVANEKQAQLNNPTPDFSQLLGMDDRELQLQADRRRDNTRVESGSSLPPLGSLGLSFKSLQDPFADPTKPANPFADPITQPQPSVSKQNTYVADVRRSRGASIGANNFAPSGPVSRHPSSVAPSHDSYRDTVFSAFSSNARKGKGRSDPFDLERPELWRRTNNQNFENPVVTGHSRAPSLSGGDSSVTLYPAPINTSTAANQNPPSGYGQPRINSPVEKRVTSGGTYESKYSSGVSSLGGWGDPGPDLGPGSSANSFKSMASSNEGVGKAM